MCNEIFSDTVIDHFMSPRNSGSMPDADCEGSCGDPSCGDSLTLYLKIRDDIIEDISFLVFGCAAAIAASSMTTVLAKGKTIKEALNISDTDIANALGGLPDKKIHCSVLGASALKNAIGNYYKTHSFTIENPKALQIESSAKEGGNDLGHHKSSNE